MAKGKITNALASAKKRASDRLNELQVIKAARNMDRKELKKLGMQAGVGALAGGYAGYKAQEYIQGSDKVPDNMKAPLGIPLTTWLGGAGAVVSAKKLRGTQAVVVSTALGGVAGGGLAFKLANGV